VLVDEPDRAGGFDRAVVGVDRAVGDRGERRLPGAVLADERVNLARRKLEVDAVDGLDRTEAAADAAQRQSGTRVNDASSSRVDGTRIAPSSIICVSRASVTRFCTVTTSRVYANLVSETPPSRKPSVR